MKENTENTDREPNHFIQQKVLLKLTRCPHTMSAYVTLNYQSSFFFFLKCAGLKITMGNSIIFLGLKGTRSSFYASKNSSQRFRFRQKDTVKNHDCRRKMKLNGGKDLHLLPLQPWQVPERSSCISRLEWSSQMYVQISASAIDAPRILSF